jgi:hypothetical protein
LHVSFSFAIIHVHQFKPISFKDAEPHFAIPKAFDLILKVDDNNGYSAIHL